MAMSILRSVQPVANREFVFGTYGQGFKSWSASKAALKDGVAAWTVHDLRKTMRTGLGRVGVQPHVAELAINHCQEGIKAVYDRGKYEGEIVAAFVRWADHVASVTDGAARKVVPLKAA